MNAAAAGHRTMPKALARRHPVAAFVGLTLAWSWSLWSLLFLFGGQGTLLRGAAPMAYAIAALGACGPSLAGLLLTRWLDGRDGLRAIAVRLRPGPLARWWPALLLIPAVTALTPALRAAGGHAQDTAAMLDLLGPGLALGLAAGVMEEFGWRGFLLPHLLARHPPLTAALFVGGVWGGLWHGYADYFGVSGDGPVFWLLLLLLGPGLLTAWSLVLTRVHVRSGGNLLLSILLHAGISSSALVFGQHYAGRGDELAWTAGSVALALLAAALCWRVLPVAAAQRPGPAAR